MTAQRIASVVLLTVAFALPSLSQRLAPSSDPDSLFFAAVRLQRSQEFAEARTVLRKLLAGFPAYYDARILLARLLAWDEQYTSSLEQLDSVLFAEPSNAEARLTKAQVLAWSKRYRQAADILLSLLSENPKSVLYKTELGKVYLWGGSPRRALPQFEAAYLLNPNSIEALRGLARTHRQARSYELSLYWYRKLLQQNPNDSEAQSEILRMTYKSNLEVQLQMSYEDFSVKGIKAHSIGQAEVYISPDEDWKPFLHYSRVSKFSSVDNRFGAGTYVTLDYSTSLLAQAIVSPNATIAPLIDALAEVTAGIGGGFDVIAGYRYVNFDSTYVHILQPGASWYLASDSWLTAKAYIGLTSTGGTTSSYTATLYYMPDPLVTIRLGGFMGTEAFRATTLNELSTLKTTGGFLAAKWRVAKPVAVEGLYQYTSRTSPANSHLALLTLSFLF